MITTRQLVLNWLREAGRRDPLWINDTSRLGLRPGFRETDGFGRLFIDDENRLVFSEARQPRLIFAQFVGHRRDLGNGSAVLLNGDGLSNRLTNHQTLIREWARREVTTRNLAIIPFAALRGAGTGQVLTAFRKQFGTFRDYTGIEIDPVRAFFLVCLELLDIMERVYISWKAICFLSISRNTTCL